MPATGQTGVWAVTWSLPGLFLYNLYGSSSRPFSGLRNRGSGCPPLYPLPSCHIRWLEPSQRFRPAYEPSTENLTDSKDRIPHLKDFFFTMRGLLLVYTIRASVKMIPLQFISLILSSPMCMDEPHSKHCILWLIWQISWLYWPPKSEQ